MSDPFLLVFILYVLGSLTCVVCIVVAERLITSHTPRQFLYGGK